MAQEYLRCTDHVIAAHDCGTVGRIAAQRLRLLLTGWKEIGHKGSLPIAIYDRYCPHGPSSPCQRTVLSLPKVT